MFVTESRAMSKTNQANLRIIHNPKEKQLDIIVDLQDILNKIQKCLTTKNQINENSQPPHKQGTRNTEPPFQGVYVERNGIKTFSFRGNNQESSQELDK